MYEIEFENSEGKREYWQTKKRSLARAFALLADENHIRYSVVKKVAREVKFRGVESKEGG